MPEEVKDAVFSQPEETSTRSPVRTAVMRGWEVCCEGVFRAAEGIGTPAGELA